MQRLRLLAILAMVPAAPALAETPIVLGWPVACTVGTTCEIQHYVAHGTGGVVQDYRCGSVTYKDHNGTDIRILTMRDERAGVDVVAAAPGKVLRTRDGVEDVSVRVIGADAVRGHQCGNGLVIAHANGFETQYCHMAKGSLVVKPGDVVTTGQTLGHVGLSGDTEFPHLHITVRHDGTMIDPFAYGETEGACSGGVSLWAPALEASLRYKAGTVLNTSFATRPMSMDEVENGVASETLGPDSVAIVANVRALSLKPGDVQRIVLVGPQGPLADHSVPPLGGTKDQVILGIGRKKPPAGWPPGQYSATYTVERAGAVVIQKTFTTTIGS